MRIFLLDLSRLELLAFSLCALVTGLIVLACALRDWTSRA